MVRWRTLAAGKCGCGESVCRRSKRSKREPMIPCTAALFAFECSAGERNPVRLLGVSPWSQKIRGAQTPRPGSLARLEGAGALQLFKRTAARTSLSQPSFCAPPQKGSPARKISTFLLRLSIPGLPVAFLQVFLPLLPSTQLTFGRTLQLTSIQLPAFKLAHSTIYTMG